MYSLSVEDLDLLLEILMVYRETIRPYDTPDDIHLVNALIEKINRIYDQEVNGMELDG